jgi:endonuclease YncB( thermonuclease family)
MKKVRLLLPILLSLILLIPSCTKRETKTPSLAENYPNRIAMDKSLIRPDDGDSFHYDTLTIRVLGMDTPEITHEEHGFFQDQLYGREAAAKTWDIIKNANRIEYVPHQNDKYGRLLAHVFVDGELLSVKLIREGLAYETITQYGDNGFPDLAQHILLAMEESPKPQFKPPWKWRQEHRQQPKTTE